MRFYTATQKPISKDTYKMTDYLKILILDLSDISLIYQNPLLIDYQTIDNVKRKQISGGEEEDVIQTKQIKIYNGAFFCFFDYKLEIILKPHYYKNQNLHNADSFTALESIKLLTEFQNTFGFSVDAKILNNEFGLNFISSISATDLITFTTHHEQNEFINSSDNLRYSKVSYKHNAKGTANNYKKIKYYAKGLQFPEYAHKNTVRFEVKSKKTQYIKSQLNIYTYADLLKPETYINFANQLKKEWGKVLVLNPDFNRECLNAKDVIKLDKYSSPFHWKKKLDESKNTFNNNKKKYYELLDKSNSNLHKETSKIIDIELTKLTKGCAILPPLSNNKKLCHFERIYNINQHKVINTVGTNNESKCLVTGLNISMQKKGSFLLSITGLKYYFNTDKKIYNEIKRQYLTSKWENSNLDNQIKEIAHNIRTIRNNQKLKQKKLYPKNQISLFNTELFSTLISNGNTIELITLTSQPS
jgi:hypothetical protein